MHRQFQEPGDVLARIAVGGQLQAFEFALGDRREFAAFARPDARDRVEQREAARVDFEQLVGRERDVRTEEDDQPALAALGLHRKGDAATCPARVGAVLTRQSSRSKAMRRGASGAVVPPARHRRDSGVLDDGEALLAGHRPSFRRPMPG